MTRAFQTADSSGAKLVIGEGETRDEMTVNQRYISSTTFVEVER